MTSQLEPYIPKHPLAQIAWLDCLRWAIGKDDMRKMFQEETDHHYRAAMSPIESMVDEATGYTGEYVVNFVRWFNGRIWGENVDQITGECTPLDYESAD